MFQKKTPQNQFHAMQNTPVYQKALNDHNFISCTSNIKFYRQILHTFMYSALSNEKTPTTVP